MTVRYSSTFDWDERDPRTRVFQIFPDVHFDNRGSYCEVMKNLGEWDENSELPLWMADMHWMRQINRSVSNSGTIRGCHAQRGVFCQGKLVECVYGSIFDVITDARPDSKSFGVTEIYPLSPITQNKLWVPRGFLHGFCVPNNVSQSIFMYYVDNSYNRESEVGIKSTDIIPNAVRKLEEMRNGEGGDVFSEYDPLICTFQNPSHFIYSEKDMNGIEYVVFMKEIRKQYEETGRKWYEK